MKELVDLKKLRDIIDELAEDDGDREIVQVDSLLSRLKDCTLSPKECKTLIQEWKSAQKKEIEL